MTRELAICLAGLILIQSGSVGANAKIGQVADSKKRVEHAESHPDLTAKFDDVAQLKIVSRKSNFHLGEMITLDIALLNVSSQPLFFRTLSELQIKVQDAGSHPLMVQDYGVSDRAVVPNSFLLLPPNQMIVRSVQLIAGCDKRAFARAAATEDDDVTSFKNGLFLTWGDACVPITQTDAYTFNIEIKNTFVVLTRNVRKVRTAVGTIKSNSLELTVQ